MIIGGGFTDIRAAEGESGPVRASIDVYNGGPLVLAGWPHPVTIDIRGLKLPGQLPVLQGHENSVQSMIGHATPKKAANAVTAEAVLARDLPDVQRIVALAAIGSRMAVSIGAVVDRVEFIRAGSTAQANGKTVRGPAFVARASRMNEVTMVPIGADATASARIAAKLGKDPAMEFEKWAAENGWDIEAMEDSQVEQLKAMHAKAFPDPKAPKTPLADPPTVDDPDGLQAQRVVQAAETQRVADIRKVCQNRFPEIENKAILAGWSANDTELEILRKERPQFTTTRGKGDVNGPRVLEAALLMQTGIEAKTLEGMGYTEKDLDAAMAPELQAAGLHSVLFETIHAADGYVRPGSVTDGVIKAAFLADRKLVQASGGTGFSTVSLTGILGNVANKSMLAAFNAIPSVIDSVASTSTVNDFKKHTRFRLTGQGVFEKVGPAGELKHAGLSEESFDQQAETYGRLLALTRQMLINDDLGAFTQLAQIIGRMAALNREEIFWTLLLSNPGAFFSAGNKNLITGAASALSVDSLTVAEQAFLDQTDSEGKPVLITPSILLVPTSLKVAADRLMAALETRNPAATADVPTSNPHAGKFAVRSTPYLNAQAVPGQSATAWYLLSSPVQTGVAFMDVAYLRGRRTPVIESSEADFDTLGMKWRGFWDFGVAMQDHRGVQKTTGVA